MNGDTQRDIAQRILQALYEAWERHTLVSLNPVQAEGGWDKALFRTVVDRLEDDGLIRGAASGYSFAITPDGISRAEENQIVPADNIERHQQIRSHILEHLAKLYELEGSRAHAHYEKIAEGAPVRHAMEILKDLSYLSDLNEIEAASTSSYRMTNSRYRNFRGADLEELL